MDSPRGGGARATVVDLVVIGLTVGMNTLYAIYLRPAPLFLGAAGATFLLCVILLRRLHRDERSVEEQTGTAETTPEGNQCGRDTVSPAEERGPLSPE